MTKRYASLCKLGYLHWSRPAVATSHPSSPCRPTCGTSRPSVPTGGSGSSRPRPSPRWCS